MLLASIIPIVECWCLAQKLIESRSFGRAGNSGHRFVVSLTTKVRLLAPSHFYKKALIDPTSHKVRENLITDHRDIPLEIINEWKTTRNAYNLLIEEKIVHFFDPEDIIQKNNNLLSAALKADIEDKNIWNLLSISGRTTWSILRERVPPSAFEYLISQAPGRVYQANEFISIEDQKYFFTDGKVKFQRDNYGKRGKVKREQEAEFICLFPYTHGSSLAVNQALLVAEEMNLIPLTDSIIHQRFLNIKHQRLSNELGAKNSNVIDGVLPLNPEKLRRLTFTIFEQLISEPLLEKISFEEALKFRQQSKPLVERFKLYVADLTTQISASPWEDKYEDEIRRIIYNKVLPEVQKAQDGYLDIWRNLFGKVSKKLLTALSPSVVMTVFAGASIPALIAGGITAVGTEVLDAIADYQKVKRNSLTYLIEIKDTVSKKNL